MIISSRHPWLSVDFVNTCILISTNVLQNTSVFNTYDENWAFSYVFIWKIGHQISNWPDFRQKCPFCIKTRPNIIIDPFHHKVTTNINGSPFSCQQCLALVEILVCKFLRTERFCLMRSAFINASKITPCIKYGYGRPP